MADPAAGIAPIRVPVVLPRSQLGQTRAISCRGGIRLPIFGTDGSGPRRAALRVVKTSVMPNIPMVTGIMSIPFCNMAEPKSKRATPETVSNPTMPKISPIAPDIRPASIAPSTV